MRDRAALLITLLIILTISSGCMTRKNTRIRAGVLATALSCSLSVDKTSGYVDPSDYGKASNDVFSFNVEVFQDNVRIPSIVSSIQLSKNGTFLNAIPTSVSENHTLAYSPRALGNHEVTFQVTDAETTKALGECVTNVAVLEKIAKLDSIAFKNFPASLAKGTATNIALEGTYDDNSTRDLTLQANWSSNNTTRLGVNNQASNKGRAVARELGIARVTATIENLTVSKDLEVTDAILESIAVTPTSISVAKGLSRQFKAIGHYSDNSAVNITKTVNWSSSNPAKATIDNSANKEGRLKGVSEGTSQIVATLSSITSNSASVTVTPKVQNGLSISPLTPTIQVDETKQFIAKALYSDGSSKFVTTNANTVWTSSHPGRASVNNSTERGKVLGKAAGTATISASYGSYSAETVATVKAVVLQSVEISPRGFKLAPNNTKQLKLIAHYSDGSESIVTSSANWSSNATATGTVANSGSNKGLAQGKKKGTFVVTASYQGKSNTLSIPVDLRELYFTYTRTGTSNQTLNQVIGSNHEFSSFNFKNKRFKIFVSVRLLSRINYGGKQSYSASDVSRAHSFGSYSKINSINRNYADRTGGCTPVPASVFSSLRVDLPKMQSGGSYLNLSSRSSSTYIVVYGARDRWATTGQGSCYPTIHSSRKDHWGAIKSTPNLSGSASPYKADGYSNTYGNGGYVYVDTAGKLHLYYKTQSSHSRVVFQVGIISDEL